MPHVLNDQESIVCGIAPTDLDNKPIASLPSGATVTYTSTDPSVCGVVPSADGMSVTVTSGNPGTASVTVHVQGIVDSKGNPIAVADETLDFEVVNSAPGALNFTAGDPVPE
jgi:hypothetical protein